MKIGIIANYTLDAAVSSILLDTYFKHDEIVFKCGGYGKFLANMAAVINAGVEKIIVVGFPLTNRVYSELAAFKNFIVFDNSDDTRKLENNYNIFHHPGSTSMAVSRYILNNSAVHRISAVPFRDMVLATNMFINGETSHRLFNLGYKLNTLFFKMNMWSFKNEFQYGLPNDNKFPQHVRVILKDHFNRRNKKLFTSKPTLIGKNGALYHDDEFIDDYAIAIPGYKVYYTIRKDFTDPSCMAVSMRVAPAERANFNLRNSFDEYHTKMMKNPDMIDRHFGNKNMFGMVFENNTSVAGIVEFLEDFNAFLEDKRIDKRW